MFCIGYTPTLLEGLHEEILGIVKFMKQVGFCFKSCMKKQQVLWFFMKQVEISLYYCMRYYLQWCCMKQVYFLLVHSDLLHSRSLFEVVRKLNPRLRVVVLYLRYWSDALNFYFCVDIFCVNIFVFMKLFALQDILIRRTHMFHIHQGIYSEQVPIGRIMKVCTAQVFYDD